MLNIHMYGKELGAWLPIKIGMAAYARFIRHHMHELRCDHTPVFNDDPDVEFTDVRLLDLEIGKYNAHLGEGRTMGLTVTKSQILLGGVLITTIPNREYPYVSPGHAAKFGAVLEMVAGRRVDVYYAHTLTTAKPGEVIPDNYLDYSIRFLTEPPVPPQSISWTYLGVLDMKTGQVKPLNQTKP